ncbi:MAG: tRNA (adenosine(37)-N6)-threonylcarbamoyltransferase complex transferase subunit TsaD [Synergistales bacterium]|nr:tRNA (adenosine(37)-N6)-threonylcarbamoyltransferase complex transferase subunit TsaD [Synergistales bacterium]MDY6401408.1 tRNA (adenosine(37)-N6)-threonylcarbamoyltransferase complex transferase subunit TsaD [Synergistales bacterium]MDY6404923.1 tRNA (adenosine(37)-N6)-threonylcarbamoyltransferase complex transferase subunit TsaD [Synergistales bacterium]MDY6410380.1 tRNA (adenosine(37)-N6)-threonylcarbamoyltransferase complex transferase subunit TsaD [Synergistales bacterium]MDY6414732.1 
MNKNFLTLGIETSCDDTGVAILKNDNEVLCEFLSSQIKDHSRFGGVIPEFAARKHLENLLPLVNAALKEINISGRELNLIAVTRGPGLMGSLIVGVQTAKALSQVWGVPLIGVNHLEGHLFAPLVDAQDLEPPFLSLIVSGGHTEIIKVNSFGNYELIGQTRDDAAGEAYDKAARILGLKYPGGPEIDRRAKIGDPHAFNFPVPLKNTDKIEFSFSGLKTALLWQVKKFENEGKEIPIDDLCASFQKSVTEALTAKINLAVKLTGIKKVSASGGVSANSALRDALKNNKNFRAWLPELKRCTDNAVMVAMAGRNSWTRKKFFETDVIPDPSLHEL